MLVLFETAGGYALFKVLDESKLKNVEKLNAAFSSVDKAQKIVSLAAFHRFENTTEALAATTALVESKLHKSLRRFLRKEVSKGQSLGLSDLKLGGQIKDALKVSISSDAAVQSLLRGIRSQLDGLLENKATSSDMNKMRVGLAHSLSRYRLKFSPDKVDTMIVQAIGLLDDLDKELNNYAMRAREWYGWHFPELSKIIPDHQMFVRCVKLVGERHNAETVDLTQVLPQDLVEDVRAAAKVSMGTEVSEEDIANIMALCEQVIGLGESREQLYEYLRNRMQAIAPNLTILVGELVGARLIAHVGTLLGLSKLPASTLQIIGAEKALFRALKTKHNTPKYGLIYHASLVGQASTKNKGKMARTLAAKLALSIRVDALCEEDGPAIAVDDRAKLENRARQLEGVALYQGSATSKGSAPTERYSRSASRSAPSYSSSTDTTIASQSAPLEDDDMDVDAAEASSSSKKSSKKDKKDKKDKKSSKKDKKDKSSKKDKKDKSSKKDKKDKRSERSSKSPSREKKSRSN